MREASRRPRTTVALALVLALVVATTALTPGLRLGPTSAPSGSGTPRANVSSGTAGYPWPVSPYLGVDGFTTAFDSTNGNVYALNNDNDTVIPVNGTTRQEASPAIPLEAGPTAAAFDSANGDLYVLTGENLSVVDPTSGEVTVPAISFGPSGSTDLVVDPVLDRVFVSAPEGVWVINGTTQTLIGAELAVPNAGPMAFDPDDGTVYVETMAGGSSSNVTARPLAEVNATEATVRNETVGPPLLAGDVAYDPDTGLLYATSTGLSEVAIINPSTTGYTLVPDAGRTGGSVVVAPGPAIVYFGNEATGSAVQALNATTGSFDPVFLDVPPQGDGPTTGEPLALAPVQFDPRTGFLFLTDVACREDVGFGTVYCDELLLAVHESHLSPVTLRATGLPSGSRWAIALLTEALAPGPAPSEAPPYSVTTTSASITLSLWPGTYPYYLTTVHGVRASGAVPPWSGAFTVNGSTNRITIAFWEVQLPVAFDELGLPAGTAWTVTASGGPGANTSSTSGPSNALSLELANGTYTVGATAAGYRLSVGTYLLTVNGSAGANQTIEFVPNPASGLAVSWEIVLAILGVLGATAMGTFLVLRRRPPLDAETPLVPPAGAMDPGAPTELAPAPGPSPEIAPLDGAPPEGASVDFPRT